VKDFLSGLLVGLLLGQILSFLTLAIDDCISDTPSDYENRRSIFRGPYRFFFLWGQFIGRVLKLSIIGFCVILAGILIISLMPFIRVYDYKHKSLTSHSRGAYGRALSTISNIVDSCNLERRLKICDILLSNWPELSTI
jgi:hypothetical protein